MAYNNYNQNNQERKSVNTNSTSMASAKTAKPILLLVSYWDDMLKIALCNELPENQQTEYQRFDRKNNISTSVTREKCHELAEAYRERLHDKLTGKEVGEKSEDSVSVTIGGVNQLMLSAKINESGEYYGSLSLVKGFNPETLISDDITEFVFPKGEYIVGYNPTNGSFKERVITNNGIEVFWNDLITFRCASTKAFVHATRCVERSFKERVYDAIVQIGSRVGANIPQYNNGTGNSRYGSGASPFDRNNAGSPIGTQQTMTLDELDASLSQAMNSPVDIDEELPFN